MEIGIDTFASAKEGTGVKNNADSMEFLLDKIELADNVGLDIWGIGQHYREEFLDSANHMILAAASQRTKNIRLASAVTVLSTADPVRVFQDFATLDLLSGGRAEIVAGRGSFTEAYPLFGYRRQDYEPLFEEKLDLLLQIRERETLSWRGKFRPELINLSIYPRPLQAKLPIWRGVGGTPTSFQRAGQKGLPLMIAIIGGETHRFRPLVDIYKRAYLDAGHDPAEMRVGVHSLGFIADTTDEAIDIYYPGYKKMFDRIGKERGWPPVTKDRFLHQISPLGALVVSDPESAAEKILRHSEALGGISRFTFQMDSSLISNEQYVNAIELIGKKIKPLVNKAVEEKPLAM